MMTSTDAEEKAQTIVLTYRGEQVNYHGLPSQKREGVLHLLAKQADLTKEVAVETYRANLPYSDTVTADDVWEMVRRTRQRLNANTRAPPPAMTTSGNTSAGGENGKDTSAELYNMGAAEQKDSHDFMCPRFETPTVATGVLLCRQREEGAPHEMPAVLAHVAGSTGTPQKLPLYLQERGNEESVKLLYVNPSFTYADFRAAVDAKFGCAVKATFFDGEDYVEVDDDDVLAVYMAFVVNGSAKKHRLFCSRATALAPAAPPAAAAAQATTLPTGYTNGELEVFLLNPTYGEILDARVCALSPNGDQVAVATESHLYFWNWKQECPPKQQQEQRIESCAYSPNGDQLVTCSRNDGISLWDTKAMTVQKRSTDLKGGAFCVAFSSDHQHIVSCSANATVCVWNAASLQKEATLRRHSSGFLACAFSNTDNGKYVASSGIGRTIRITDWAANTEVAALKGHAGVLCSLSFSHDDRFLVSGSWSGELKVWDVRNYTLLRSLERKREWVKRAVFSADDDYIFSVSGDGRITFWGAADGRLIESFTTGDKIFFCDISNDVLVTCAPYGGIKLWKVTRRKKQLQ